MIVLLLFFCSGATALVYEVVWSKYLSLLLGSTVYGQTVVLAVFMGGLAIGNRVFGNRADLLKGPLGAYGWIELAIGAYALVFPYLYEAADVIFVAAGRPVLENSVLLLGLKLVLSAGLLLGPTILMGGTLPLLASWIQEQPRFDTGSRIGIFYATNSLGAVAGAALAGLYLVQTLGMSYTVQATALANCAIGGLALWLNQREKLQTLRPREREAVERVKIKLGWPAVLVAITGGVSMGLEVLAARSLSLVVGASLQAFALVLMAFILGIGIGSVLISSAKWVRGRETAVLYAMLFSAGTLVAIYVIMIEHWAVMYSYAKFGLARNEMGYVFHQTLVGVIALVVLGVPAAFLGAVVPLTIRILAENPQHMGQKVGHLLTWNTLGAVVGVLITGFFLMPLLGLRAAFTVLSLGLLVVGGLIAQRRGETGGLVAAGVLGVIVLAGIIMTGEQWRKALSLGIFRNKVPLTFAQLKVHKEWTEQLYYKDAADATVTVERDRRAEKEIVLRTNGKPEASTKGDLATQYLVAHLPLLMRPEAKDVFLLGFGSGITGGAVLGHPVDQLVIAENCLPVLEAGKYFAEWNRGVLTNSRTKIITEDARTVLKLSPQNYDVIICEPSNPWVAGVGGVFSREFYELGASRLKEGGIMAQWFHIYEMHDEIVFLVLRTFASVFPHLEIWDTQDGDLVLLGSMQPWDSNPAVYQKVFERPEVRDDLVSVGVGSGVALWARQMASQRTASAIPGAGLLQTDEFPVLEYAAPKAFFLGERAVRLARYDERTKQFPLASKEKLAVLQSLPKNVLLGVFDYYSTSNPDLVGYFNALRKENDSALNSVIPVAFRLPSTYLKPEELAGEGERIELYRMELELLRNPAEWAQIVDRMEKLMLEVWQDPEKKAQVPLPYFAALATKYAVGNGDSARALRLCTFGLNVNFQDDDLLFLSRVIDSIIPPEHLQRMQQAAGGR